MDCSLRPEQHLKIPEKQPHSSLKKQEYSPLENLKWQITPFSFGEELEVRYDEKEIIRMASALEQNSEHPIATEILAKAKELSITIPAVNNFNAITGKGIEAEVEGKKIKVVSPGYLKENNIALPENSAGNNAETIVFIIVEGKLAGYISLGDKNKSWICGSNLNALRQ